MTNRKYEETHPWITFELDLRNLEYSAWILLGAVQSKCKHLSGIPLDPRKRRELLSISLRKGVRATTAIEGNSLSEDEVKRIIEGSSSLPKSKNYQSAEIENVLNVYNEIAWQIERSIPCEISRDQIKRDNATILRGLELNNSVVPGEIRTHSVTVQKYRGAPAEDCEYLLSRLCEWLNERWEFGDDNSIIEAVFKAVMSHLYIAWIHPFADGNGRTARALELRILMASGVPMNAAHLLSNHYNETRSEYYAYLDKTSSVEKGRPASFITYAVQGLADALDNQIETILNEQLRVTWVNYVHERFAGSSTQARSRQKRLALEISEMSGPATLSEIKKRLSDELLRAYKDKTRVFGRDINALCNMDLLKKDGAIISAAKDALRMFLPVLKSP